MLVKLPEHRLDVPALCIDVPARHEAWQAHPFTVPTTWLKAPAHSVELLGPRLDATQIE